MQLGSGQPFARDPTPCSERNRRINTKFKGVQEMLVALMGGGGGGGWVGFMLNSSCKMTKKYIKGKLKCHTYLLPFAKLYILS